MIGYLLSPRGQACNISKSLVNANKVLRTKSTLFLLLLGLFVELQSTNASAATECHYEKSAGGEVCTTDDPVGDWLHTCVMHVLPSRFIGDGCLLEQCEECTFSKISGHPDGYFYHCRPICGPVA